MEQGVHNKAMLAPFMRRRCSRGLGISLRGLLNTPHPFTVVCHHSERIRSAHDLKGTLLNGVDDAYTYTLQLHRSVVDLGQVQAPGATHDQPLLSVRPVLH